MGKLLLVMGVAGSGKSVLSRSLAKSRGSVYIEADDFHSQENLLRMGRGLALSDEDRQPWLEGIVEEIRHRLAQPEVSEVVLACSALRQDYRDTLAAATDQCQIIYLKVSLPVARQRVAERKDHFFPVVLVQDQFMALEEPEDAITIDAGLPTETQIRQILARLEL